MGPVSFMSANFVARQLGYRMDGGWGQGDRTTNAFFAPIETFPERFGGMLDAVRAMGFRAIDLWLAHLHWSWATEAHLVAARDLLDRHGLRVVSLAGGFGATPEEFAAAARIAEAMGAGILGGSTPLLATDRAAVIETLDAFDLRLAVENHLEKTPDEMLAKLGDAAGGRVGTAVDTGWYATQSYDAADAITVLGDRVLHVHLKDVRAAGAHHTVALGDGIVPVERCLAALRQIGYAGRISIEHGPDDRDPTAECVESLTRLHGWLGV